MCGGVKIGTVHSKMHGVNELVIVTIQVLREYLLYRIHCKKNMHATTYRPASAQFDLLP